MNTSVLDEKSHFRMLGLSFFSKFDWGFIIYIAKTGSKKIEAFLGSVKFLSPKVTLYLYFFIGFAWNTIVMSGLLLLAATLKWYISSESGYVGLLVLDMLHLLNTWFIVKMYPA